ncbi:MAG: hypothetical protein WCG75_06180 [Armatimonadota bacterium]
MSSERLYTEAEAVEIIQRALSDPASESPTNSLTQNDLWRIAEEAGATRSQFESALATTVSKVSVEPSKGSMGTTNYSCVIAGELTPDDFIVIEEQIPETFGGKFVKQEERTMKVRVDKGSAIVVAIVSTRKGQTSIRVTASHFMAVMAGFLVWILFSFVGFLVMISNNSQTAWLVFALALFAGTVTGMTLAKEANKKGREFFNLLSGLVSNAVASNSVALEGVSSVSAKAQGTNETTDLQHGL